MYKEKKAKGPAKYVRLNEGYSRERADTGRKTKYPEFLNAVAVGIDLAPGIYTNVKIYSNGSLQFVGLKSRREIDYFIRHLSGFLQQFADILPAPLQVECTSLCMVIYECRILGGNTIIDSHKLQRVLDAPPYKSRYKYQYERNKSKEFKIIDGNRRYTIYQSGKINVTGRSIEEIPDSYRFITEFINGNIDKIAMKSRILHGIELVKYSSKSPGQLSDQWFADRLGKCTASQAASVVGLDYGRRGVSKYISKKVAEIRGDRQSDFIHRASVNHGSCFEPILGHTFCDYVNSSPKWPYSVLLYDCYLINHQQHPDKIAASPDGILFTMKGTLRAMPDPPSIPELIYLEKSDNLYDCCVVEMKNPRRYKQYCSENSTKSPNKCIKVRGGWIPEYYWCQMQLQMIVTDMKYGIFINSNIQKYETEAEFASAPAQPRQFERYFGIVAWIGPDDYPKYIYPEIGDGGLLTRDFAGFMTRIRREFAGKRITFYWWRMYAMDICEVEYDKSWCDDVLIPKILEAHEKIDEISKEVYYPVPEYSIGNL